MFLKTHWLVSLLALTLHGGNGEDHSDQDSCPQSSGSGSKDQCSGDFYVEREISVMTEGGFDMKQEDLHAQTIRLKAGSWCVTVAYDDRLGPRLLAVLWMVYDELKVAYTVLRSPDKNSCPPTKGWLNINIEAHAPFTIHATFVPGINVGKDQVVTEQCHCDNEHARLKLDGSHVDRLLACHVEGQRKTWCRWSRRDEEEEKPAADVARWSTPSEDSIPAKYDLFVGHDEEMRFVDTWPWVQEGGPFVVGQRFLVSDWIGLRADPGCLRLWLYAWGSIPHHIQVRIQKKNTMEWDADEFELLTPPGHLVTWKEQHIPVKYQEFRIIVEFRGLSWTGSLIVDDISADGVECTGKDPGKYIVPSL